MKRSLIALGGALALGLAFAQPVLAQAVVPDRPGVRSESDIASGTTNGEVVLPGRIGGDRADRERRQESRREHSRSGRRGAAPQASPEQTRAAAQAASTAAGLSCQVTEATALGVSAEQSPIFEAACASGPGYVLIASTPPQSFGCLELAGTAAIVRARDPSADVGQQCALPANMNGVAVIGGWAREAGVTCTVDEAIAIGKSDADNMVYEVGCAGADGYWLEKVATGWQLQDCLQVASTNGVCRFTTAQEQADAFEPKLAGTDAAACDVAQVRLMGSNPNGRFYEAKCAAAGEGYIARVSNEGVTQQVYPCATAQRIGGGCTLTPAPAAAPAPTE